MTKRGRPALAKRAILDVLDDEYVRVEELAGRSGLSVVHTKRVVAEMWEAGDIGRRAFRNGRRGRPSWVWGLPIGEAYDPLLDS
jgi:predicted ArsR family transcriptional regulator